MIRSLMNFCLPFLILSSSSSSSICAQSWPPPSPVPPPRCSPRTITTRRRTLQIFEKSVTLSTLPFSPNHDIYGHALFPLPVLLSSSINHGMTELEINYCFHILPEENFIDVIFELYERKYKGMSLFCTECHPMENSREFVRSQSSRSDIEVSCCWAMRKAPSPPPPPPPIPTPSTESNIMMSTASKVAPAPSRNNSNASIAANTAPAPHTPRLVRCHAVRRDLFNNWNFEDFTAGCA